MIGTASHAGTTPMDRRRDAAVRRRRAGAVRGAARRERRRFGGHHRPLNVCPVAPSTWCPGAAFQPGPARPTDAQRDAMVTDVLDELAQIAQRRGLAARWKETMRAAAAPSAPACSTTGKTPWTRWACRCSACPAAPATTP